MSKIIKVLKIAVEDLKINTKVIKVTNFQDIVSYGVIGSHVLVVDGVFKFTGRLQRVGN